jgi:thiol-disulfide isomerase/thioredoxin
MKKIILFFLLLSVCFSYSQEFYSINDSLYKSEDFKLFLKKNKIKNLTPIFIPSKYKLTNDSLIKYGLIIHAPKSFKQNTFYNNLLKPLPTFKLEKYNGGILNSDSLKGKPTIINFWFTKCASCILEMPNLNLLKEIHKDKINTISITFDDRQEIMDFSKKYDFDFEILINSKKFIDNFGIYSFPKTILLDKNNIIRYIPLAIYAEDDKSNKYFLNQFNNEILELLKE